MHNSEPVPPPGSGRHDPYVKDIDAIGFALERIETHLIWIDEHHASFLDARVSDPKTAEQELGYLGHSIQQALPHVERLIELLLAGYTIDPNKRLPKALAMHRIRQRREASS